MTDMMEIAAILYEEFDDDVDDEMPVLVEVDDFLELLQAAPKEDWPYWAGDMMQALDRVEQVCLMAQDLRKLQGRTRWQTTN